MTANYRPHTMHIDGPWTIYVMTNILNGMQYAGRTCAKPEVRLQQHVGALNKGTHHNRLMQADAQIGNFEGIIKVICVCDTYVEARIEEDKAIASIPLELSYNIRQRRRVGPYKQFTAKQKEKAVAKVLRLVKRGMVTRHACDQLADELGCHSCTVYSWVRIHRDGARRPWNGKSIFELQGKDNRTYKKGFLNEREAS